MRHAACPRGPDIGSVKWVCISLNVSWVKAALRNLAFFYPTRISWIVANPRAAQLAR